MISAFRQGIGKMLGGPHSLLDISRSSNRKHSSSSRCVALLVRSSSRSIPSRVNSLKPSQRAARWISGGSSSQTNNKAPTLEDLPEAYREKAMKAELLSREIGKLMEKQEQRLIEDQSRGFITRTLDFARKSRSQMINIIAAFMCVVLAYQIALTRRYGRLLEQKLRESEQALGEKQLRLRSLTSDDFLKSLAEQCAAQAMASPRRSEWWTGSRASSAENLSEALLLTLQQELSGKLGDSILTEDEKKEKVMRELVNNVDHDEEDELAAIVKDEAPIEVSQDESGSKVVKKRLFSI